MASVNAAWGGRKGRTSTTQKEAAPRSAHRREAVKYAAYGNSQLLCELNSIVELFTEEQRNLGESTGFRAFAKPVHAHQFDRQFTVWLMPKVDNMARSISVSPGKKLMIFQEDVFKVFGTPCRGKEVWDASLDKSQAMRLEIEAMIGMDEHHSSPSQAAASTLRALAGQALSADEAKAFKVAFVVFVVCMLCDSHNPGEQESVNFWPAISNPDLIHTFNWSSYVLDSVFSACVAAKMATRRNCSYSPPAGSTLFLQIFYLDNMDFGQISLPKGARPRMELFDARILSKQIMAETIGLRGQTPCRQFGAGQPRKDSDVVYRRGLVSSATQGQSPKSTPEQPKRPRPEIVATAEKKKTAPQTLDLNTRLLLAVKAHKARCLKILTQARRSIEEESDKLIQSLTQVCLDMDPAKEQHDTEPTRLATQNELTPSPTLGAPRVISEAGKETERFDACDAPSFSLGAEFDEISVSGPTVSPQTPISPLGPSPPRKTMRTAGPKSPLSSIKQKSGEFLFSKRSSEKINLNEDVAELEFTQSPIARKTVCEGLMRCPPRDTSRRSCHRKMEAAIKFHTWAIGSVADSNRFWIRHATPKFIELSSADLIAQFGLNGRLEPDTCDALLRVFQQAGSDWRHYLESDFTMRVVAEEDYLSSRSIQHQWVGKHINSDISKCMLFMTMFRVQDMWASAAWDMKRRQITIHAAGNRNGEWDAYDKIVGMLKVAFRACTQFFFEGWSVDWENWATVYTTASSLSDPKPDGYDFAPEALHFCRTFDGVKQGGRLTAPKTECASPAELLFDLLHLKNNTGKLPMQFIQDIDD